MSSHISETDPQTLGVPTVESRGISTEAAKASQAVNHITSEARRILKDETLANGILLRGFSSLPELPNFKSMTQLNPAAIAAYPMYKGLAKLIGMTVLSAGTSFEEELLTLKRHFDYFVFFFLLSVPLHFCLRPRVCLRLGILLM